MNSNTPGDADPQTIEMLLTLYNNMDKLDVGEAMALTIDGKSLIVARYKDGTLQPVQQPPMAPNWN